MKRKQIKAAAAHPSTIIAAGGSVSIEAGAIEGESKGPAKFVSTFYTGGALHIEGWDKPVIIDLAGLEQGKTLVANLDHDRTKRVGNFVVANDGSTLVASGTATAHTAARDEVVKSALDGYQWQSSLEVNPTKVEATKAKDKFTVNGQSFEGEHYITRKGVLKGFAFVSHGADDNTTASIAAAAAPNKEQKMKIDAQVKAWAEEILPSLDFENLSDTEVANLTATYEGRNGKKAAPIKASDPFEELKLEAKRKQELRDIAQQAIERRNIYGGSLEDIEAIEKLHNHAITAKMSPLQFRVELQEATAPQAYAPIRGRSNEARLTNRILEAAVCEAGRLQNVDKYYKDEELQRAHDLFPRGISLNQLFIAGARANGYSDSFSMQVTPDVMRAACPSSNGQYRPQHATGFSTVDLTNVVAATANKFLHEGWMSVDQTFLEIASVKSVNNFHTHTTVSLFGSLDFEKLGPAGEIKHGTLDDLTYTNAADTYAKMLAITRRDIINDDLGALTSVPKRLGRGGMLKLNDIGWTEFLGLVTANFFAAGNSNLNAGVADMTLNGLIATEVIFLNQTGPDSKPLGIMPKVLLVPTALKAAAIALMDSQKLITGSDVTKGDANPMAGRFRVLSSPYISNSAYTGSTSTGYWLLADKNEASVIEIAALNGRIEPTVETADVDFNQLGIQMRGYSDIGVNEQEYRAGVYADGGTS